MTWHVVWVLLGKAALVFAVAGVFAFAWLLPRHGGHLLREPASRALRHPLLDGLWRRAPRLHAFLERHLHLARRSWLRLAIGCLVAACGLVWYVRLLHGVLADGTLVEADRCLHNTVGRFHSAALSQLYSLVSNLSSIVFLAPLAGGLAAVFWAAGRRREAAGLIAALAGAGLLQTVMKGVVARPRPPEALALFHDFSFPSGHTLMGVSVYGFLVYLVLRDEPRRAWHWLLAAPLLLLIGAIPVARVYLGVHWPYDTAASLALAVAWLAVLVSLVKFPPFQQPTPTTKADRPWLGSALTATVAALAVYAAVLNAQRPQRKVEALRAPPRMITTTPLLVAYPTVLSRTSQDAVGGPMEPVSMLFIGESASLVATFQRAGWELAEAPTVHGLLRELWAVLRNQADPRGPATPAYLARQPQDLTFEKAGDPSGSIRRRHHTRLWQTALCMAPGCQPLWVATASYDAGVKLVREPYLITHRIDPRVDMERDYIARDLLRAGAQEIAVLQITQGPTEGRNAAGDPFQTDGRAYAFVVR
ncbi:MAG TPA: LssY C-terminal domain-containing protein [Thermoanaerobaculia bacterium]|nr:LssY C-terminal domain-containing protein [Thermoanaerobaculia bacterium]